MSGWLKKGPVGTIATNLFDANETADRLLNDAKNWIHSDSHLNSLDSLLAKKQIKPVSFQDWLKIDDKEVQLGQIKGKPREKMVSLKDIQALLL